MIRYTQGNLPVFFLSLVLVCLRAAPDSAQAQAPREVTINNSAGRGGHLILMLRVESGEELPFLVDTGSPITILDKSLEPRLGKRIDIFTTRSSLGAQKSGVHPAPKLFLADVPLVTDSYVMTFDFRRGSVLSRLRVMGILGMDCLRHYCLQLDFEAGKLRFLDPDRLDPAGLGKPFPIIFSNVGQNFSAELLRAGQNDSCPFISHPGLFGGSNTNLLIDTGDNVDGAVETGVIKGHYLTRIVHFVIRPRALRLKECNWDGQTYTKLRVWTGPKKNQLGLRFLARHLVTFDFPKRTMYLKQTQADPLTARANR
jgi:hypothetical protein